MGWGRRATYSHAARLQAEGWLTGCNRRPGEGPIVWVTRHGMRCFVIGAKGVGKPPDPHTWPHHEACAWTAAWLTVCGREMIGPRRLLQYPERWKGQAECLERCGHRRRGHTPDLGARIPGPDSVWMQIEVELSHKSRARLNATLKLHATWIETGRSPAAVYICSTPRLAERVREAGRCAGLIQGNRTIRVELLDTIKMQTLEARSGTAAKDWGPTAIRAGA
jgi:hypothetical protein